MTSPTINGTKRPVPDWGGWQPIHLGGIPAANAEPTAPIAPPEPTVDLVAAAEAAAIRLRAEAEAEAARIAAEAEADAVRATAEAEAEKLRLANERAAMRLEKERADHDARIAEANRRRDESERAARTARETETEQQKTEAEQIAKVQKSESLWMKAALGFAIACAVVALPVQMAAFWNKDAPWLLAAPLMLEGGAWIVLAGAAAAVAGHRPHWHYRTIAWLLAFVAAGINLWHGIHAFDPATAGATAFASLAGPGIWDLHEHGRIRKRDGVLTRRERKAKERAEKRAAAEKAAREAAAQKEKDAAAKAAREAAEELAKKREDLFKDVWPHAVKLAVELGETTVTEAIWIRAHKDVKGTAPGDSPEAQQLRNAAARKLLDARADAPDKAVWKASEAATNAQVLPQVPTGRRRGSVTGPPVRGVRRPGDTAPFVDAARNQAAITAKTTTRTPAREDS